MFSRKLRKEKSKQNSGFVDIKKIPVIKNRDYYILDVHLDGEAPKEYIKKYSYYKGRPKRSNYSNWDGYFAKYGGKSYPHESVMEYLINKIGDYLGVRMNETELAIINEQIRFLSKDFLKKDQKLIHGIEVIAEYLEDKDFVDEINKNRKERRNFLTFEVIERAIEYVYPKAYDQIMTELVKMITYDAIVGNNDRHFYNWALIGEVRKGSGQPFFSPIYDTARALLWNTSDENVIKKYGQHKKGLDVMETFILKSKPRISFEDNGNCNHFELIEFLNKKEKKYSNEIGKLITKDMQEHVLSCLKGEKIVTFIAERTYLIELILNTRFEKLREVTA